MKCLIAMNTDGALMKYVPVNILTPEICLAAVNSRGSALEYVPNNMKTHEICLVPQEQ